MKKTNKLITILYLIPVLLAVLGGLFLPGYLLKRSSLKTLNQIQDVPVEYYIGKNSAVSLMSSYQLSDYERMRLISNLWDADCTTVAADSTITDSYSIVQTAKNHLQDLYECGLYPLPFISSDGDDWYSYEATRFCSTDTTFKTFSTYFWLITLTKYDNTETHKIMIQENGTILYAECHQAAKDAERIRTSVVDISTEYTSLLHFDAHPSSYIPLPAETRLPSYKMVEFPTTKSSVGVVVIGDHQITNEALLKDSYSVHSTTGKDSLEYYYVFQYNNIGQSTMHYAIGIIPYE